MSVIETLYLLRDSAIERADHVENPDPLVVLMRTAGDLRGLNSHA
jgi:hypothetical protein